MHVRDLLQRLHGVKQTRAGAADWMALCPAHADNNPSLHVSVGKNGTILLNCFAGCETDRVLLALGIGAGDLYPDSAVPSLPVRQRTAPAVTYAVPPSVRQTGIRGASAVFLRSRGIDLDLAADAGIQGDDRALTIPFIRDGQLINVKTRGLDPKRFALTTGGELIFFGLDQARRALAAGATDLVICEGELDWLSIRMADYPAVLSVPNGASGSPDHYLASASAVIDAASTVILAVDADAPGQKLEAELVRRIGPGVCRRARWPAGCNDANDVHLRHGLDALFDCLSTAEAVPISGIVAPNDVDSEYEDLYRDGLRRGLATGWADIDRYYTVVPGYLTLITGVPASGKTEWLDNLMINLALRHGWRFAAFSPESWPHAEHLSRWAEKYLGMPFFDGPHLRMSWDQAVAAKRWAQDHLRFLDPEIPTLDAVLDLARIELRRFGINGLTIDPWNEVDDDSSGMREDKYLSRALRTMRRFAEQHGVHVFVVIHPHAMQLDRDTKQYPPVDIYDLHGGSMWANKAGAIVSIWRDSQNPQAPTKVYIKKVKTRRIGGKGRINLAYDRVTGRYRETGEHEEGG